MISDKDKLYFFDKIALENAKLIQEINALRAEGKRNNDLNRYTLTKQPGGNEMTDEPQSFEESDAETCLSMAAMTIDMITDTEPQENPIGEMMATNLATAVATIAIAKYLGEISGHLALLAEKVAK